MRIELENEDYNTKLICSDWRYSASVVGLVLYFDFHDIDYKIQDDYILYNFEDIGKEKYLEFVESHYEEYMHHKKLEKWLLLESLTEEEEKLFNETLGKNTVLKSTFGKEKYSVTNKNNLTKIIDSERMNLTEGTYKTGHSLYAKFCDSGSFFSEPRHCCRLLGYYFDGSRKSKNLGYNFDKSTFVYEDCLEFDFIPFAFTKTIESMFVNNNISIKQLMESYRKLNIDDKPRRAIFENTQDSSRFIEFDAEVIVKNGIDGTFETLFIRRESIEIFKSIKKYEYIADKFAKLKDGSYLNLEREITNSIINLNKLDNIIVLLLKNESTRSTINVLIDTNIKIYNGGDSDSMEKQTLIAKISAEKVVQALEENKVKSFRNKLLSALAIEDYDNFNVILLKLSNYSGVEMSFAYDLFDDFESNKNVAFSFVNGLTVRSSKKGEDE